MAVWAQIATDLLLTMKMAQKTLLRSEQYWARLAVAALPPRSRPRLSLSNIVGTNALYLVGAVWQLTRRVAAICRRDDSTASIWQTTEGESEVLLKEEGDRRQAKRFQL